MKKYNIYIGQNNSTKEYIDLDILKAKLSIKYPEIEGYTIFKGFGVFKGENTIYDEKTIILEIITNNLNYVYIEELCYTLKELFEQESVFYTEFTIKGRLI